jgi:hypothetical protein
VKHSFQTLPAQAGRPRPVIDLVVEGLELAPQACLLDTGASEIRMGLHVAELAGIDFDSDTRAEIVVGGLRSECRAASVQLELHQGSERHVWTSTVYFCDPWPWAFALLGLGGLDPFLLTLNSYQEWFELRVLNLTG